MQQLDHPNVRCWPKADMHLALRNVRFRGQSGHDECTAKYPLMTQSGRDADDMLRQLKVGVVSGGLRDAFGGVPQRTRGNWLR
jgi:hypothetical protein